MYPLNVNMSGANLLGVESACNTPRTPEILNSLIAMTNPLDYSFADSATGGASTKDTPNGGDSNSSSSSPLGSPSNGNPPNLQQTLIKSQLIKAGLKLSIQNKRKNSGSEGDTPTGRRAKMSRKDDLGSGSDDDYGDSNSPSTGLTPEDEERRRRRRERNKIAATKCRLKKRERTVNLVTESEVLENQNIDLKTQIQELETQRRQLVDMLSMHGPSCIKTQTSSPTTGYVNYTTYTDTFLHNSDPNLNSLSPVINDLNSLNYDKIDDFASTPDSFTHTTSVTNVQTKLELPDMSSTFSPVTSTGGILSDINTNNFIGPNGSELTVPKIEVVNFDIGEEENKYTDLDEYQNNYTTVSNTTQYNEHDLNHNNGCMA